jgi:DNA-binding beta-propeller fold protein YncE
LAVVDCLGDSVLTVVNCPEGTENLTVVPSADRAYVASPEYNLVTSVDCYGDTVTAVITTGSRPGPVTSAPDFARVYVRSLLAPHLMVVDAAANQVVRVRDYPWELGSPMYNPVNHKVYFTCGDTTGPLKALDPATDSIAASVRFQSDVEPWLASVNTVNGKVYCRGWDSLYVVDGSGDTIRARLGVESSSDAVWFSSCANKLYAYADQYYHGHLTIVDGATDVVRRVYGHGGMSDAAFADNPLTNQVYFSVVGWLYLYDGLTDTLLAQTPASYATALQFWPGSNALYCFYRYYPQVVVVDGTTLQTRDTILLPGGPSSVLLDTIAGTLYCLCPYQEVVSVIDCATNEVVQSIPVGAEPVGMTWCAPLRRVYVSNTGSSSLSVVRDTAGAGVEDSPKLQASSPKPIATILRGVLFLGAGHDRNPLGDFGSCPKPVLTLLDAAGRKVMDLLPGANDVSHLPSGVYFVRDVAAQAQAQAQAVRKVVIQQ